MHSNNNYVKHSIFPLIVSTMDLHLLQGLPIMDISQQAQLKMWSAGMLPKQDTTSREDSVGIAMGYPFSTKLINN